MLYEVLKGLHIIAVIAWMAGLLYLPRLFVYHADTEKGSRQSETFKIMERRLMRGIMNPWAVVLGLDPGPAARLAGRLVACRLVAGEVLAGCRAHPRAPRLCALAQGFSKRDRNTRPARYYRWWNEVPTLLMIAIVFLAVLKPF